METILRYVIIAAVGALASILANQSIAVFNDGLRPVLPEYLEKRMDRKALAATSFAIGFGLVIGYGLPTSIAASIILIHCILLTTDIVGTWCPDTKKGMIASGVIGAVYGVALLFGLQVIIDLFNLLPVNFLGSLGQVSAGITLAFAIFPAVTVALQFGAAKGIITAIVTLLVRQIVETYGKIALDAEHTISLNKDGMALLAGMIIMLVFAAMDMVKELTEGIEGTGVRATVIGEIGTSKDITETEAKVFRAASRAHAETGAPICTHTTLGTRGLEQLEIFKSFGVDLSRVVLSHIDLSADLDYMKRLLDQGVNIAFDTIGKCNYQPDVSRADWLSRLCAEGYDTQIVMSMDITRRSNFADRGGVGYSYLLDTFAPLASEAGVPDRAWENLLYRNALRIYKGQK